MTRPVTLQVLLEPIETDLKLAQGAVRRLVTDTAGGAAVAQDDLRNWLRQLRTDIKIAEAELDAAVAYDRDTYVAASREIVNGWRARIDELRVQAALGGMETRDDVRTALSTVEQAMSAAQKHLTDAGADVRATIDAVRAGSEEAFDALVAAGRAAVAVIEKRVTETRVGDRQ